MPSRFFALREDVYVPERWYLDDPVGLDGTRVKNIWQFTDGKRIELNEQLRIPIDRPGKPLDFTAAGAGSAPIVSNRIAALLGEMAPHDTQILPVDIDGSYEPYFLLVVTRLIDCIDDNACQEVKRWSQEDGRPEKTGQYRSIYGLRIDATKAARARVFRLWGWPLPIIVAEEIKLVLENSGIQGGRFEEV